jgi:AcrR family transcriptional regulator
MNDAAIDGIDASARPRPQGGRRRLPRDERERQIVDGAIRYFAEVGFEGQTRELARRLGITQPLLFRYFPTKEALIERVFQEVYLNPWKPEWEQWLADREVPLEDRLCRYYGDYTQTIFSYDWIRIFMFSGLKGEAINTRYLALVRERILGPVCLELRAHFGLPNADAQPITAAEMEVAWTLHAGIFYVGVRKWIYHDDVPDDLDPVIRNSVRAFLSGAGAVIEGCLAARDGEETA